MPQCAFTHQWSKVGHNGSNRAVFLESWLEDALAELLALFKWLGQWIQLINLRINAVHWGFKSLKTLLAENLPIHYIALTVKVIFHSVYFKHVNHYLFMRHVGSYGAWQHEPVFFYWSAQKEKCFEITCFNLVQCFHINQLSYINVISYLFVQ